jgi:hypothetical protein
MDIPSKNDGIGRALTTVWHAAIVVIPVLLIGILFTSTNRYISVPWEQAGPASGPTVSPQRDCIAYTLSLLKLSENRLRAGVVALRHRGIQPALSA